MNKSSAFSWNKVSRGGPDECWPWQGSVNTWGYGDCLHAGKRRNASRAAFVETNGEPADGLVVCHRCDNPVCCNPAHLFAGTPAENLADCRAKGRQVYCLGAEHHRITAKLSEANVLEARRLYASGVPQTHIAKKMGVNSGTISRAVRGESWAHVA